jgi:arylamine N-acetyltransferase
MSDMDVQAYLDRIGYDGPVDVGAETLRHLLLR